MTRPSITDFVLPGQRVHLVGIGGVSMAPLAEALLAAGLTVSGSDMAESPTTLRLRESAVSVTIGHFAETTQGVDFIIRTAAARDDNPEIIAANEVGIPIFERAEAWGYIMQQYENAVCIAGTHGKTTTTSMVTHILLAADVDPTVMIGGTLPKLNATHRVGKGDTIVLESCEYYNSFHNFFPTVSVILNIEADHLDYFKNLDNIKDSFRKFANLVPENGAIIANGDDANTLDALAPLGRSVMTFGFGKHNLIEARNVRHGSFGSAFEVFVEGMPYVKIELQVPGDHNVSNALAAISAAIFLGISPAAISKGLSEFTGAGRRFEAKGEINGARVYDDYAHHPTELAALFDAVGHLGYKRTIVAFQPHTYTRTKALFDDFVRELKRPDIVYVAEIYAAREQNTVGVHASELAAEIPNATHLTKLSDITDAIAQIAMPGDIILTVGAGDIFKAGEALVERKL